MSKLRRRVAGAVLAASVLAGGVGAIAAPDASAAPQHGNCEFSHKTPTIQYKSVGKPVAQAQCLLDAAGKHLTTDGRFGDNTLKATKAFQGAHNLDPDGVIGPYTWKALWKYYKFPSQ